jgi:guanylate kinase
MSGTLHDIGQLRSISAVTVLVLPPSLAELERRLRGRSTDSDEVIRRRLAAARDEVRRGLASYAYVLVNDDLDAAQARLEAIAAHERARRAGRVDAAAAAGAAACLPGAADLSAWER